MEKIQICIPYDNIFKKINRRIVELFGATCNLNYMQLKTSAVPINKNGTICASFPAKEYGGCWTKHKTIYLNPDYKTVMLHYFGEREFSSDEITNFTSLVIAHELGHEIYSRAEFKDLVQKLTQEAQNKNFSTVYLEKCKNTAEELFCEYFAYLITR